MKRVYKRAGVTVLSGVAMIALSGCLGTAGTSSESGAGELVTSQTDTLSVQSDQPEIYEPIFPTAPDSYEGAIGDNNISTASVITVDEPLQGRSIFPQGDYGWVKVELEEGVVYDLFTTNLNETGDTYLYLYDMDGVQIDRNDDHIDYDSYMEFNATYTGTYYLKDTAPNFV